MKMLLEYLERAIELEKLAACFQICAPSESITGRVGQTKHRLNG